jgi:hypothetical protein
MVEKISELSLQIQEREFKEPELCYRERYYEHLTKIMDICEALEENDKIIVLNCITNTTRFFYWIRSTNINEWRENETKKTKQFMMQNLIRLSN